ncbi:putative RING-H2 finger protein ATL53 [Bidens hawaiensis]|uniref:putative RING-H2 finger protein ATL53 n=1 Tax=Bidens hawaiensis TaxID=980011 RepID=UPI00404926F5
MGSMDSPTTWVPYMSNQDCSQKICNLYCPQWCNYIDFPSPPPPIGFSNDGSSSAALSPLVITIIGVFGSACLLISYYVIISRLCTISNDSFESIRWRGTQNQETRDLEMSENDLSMEDDPLNLGPWHVPGKGLDEAMIKSIRVCKYKKEDSLVSSTDCLVCLGEFEEDDKLRLLPKCSHAFHVYCIDNWLTNHSNCPLCRANVSYVNVMSHTSAHLLPPPLPPPPPPPPPPRHDMFVSRRIPCGLERRDVIVDIREEEGGREVRRSVSMGNLCQSLVPLADILFVNHRDDMKLKELQVGGDVGSSKQFMKSKQCQYEYDAGSSKEIVDGDSMYLNCGDVGHDMLKRSCSSGRYLFIRGWKGKTLKVSSVST